MHQISQNGVVAAFEKRRGAILTREVLADPKRHRADNAHGEQRQTPAATKDARIFVHRVAKIVKGSVLMSGHRFCRLNLLFVLNFV
ncbi:MAG: hypothetical protein KKI02_01920 [Planctomycetes bacterium]|nr:hypothetical protein [Planctomycetota bacterium]